MTLNGLSSNEISNKLHDVMDIVTSAGMGIWRLKFRDGRKPRLAATDKMVELLGLDPEKDYAEEDLYVQWSSRVCPETQDIANAYLENLKKGHHDEVVYLWEHPVFGKRWIRCGGISYMKDDGTQVLEGYHYDVTEIESKRMRDEFVIRSLAETYSCLYYINLNKDTFISYVNNLPHVQKYIPQSGTFSVGETQFLKHLCHEDFKAVICDFLDLTTLNKRLEHRNYISVQFQSVTDKWIEASFIVCDRNPDGTVHHMVMGTKDIDAQKVAEMKQAEELRENVQANISKTRMLQNMTHEIRTPLNAMFGFAQLLCLPGDCVTEEQKAEYFSHIYNSFNMLTMLIDDVLDLANAEHGNYRVTLAPFAINAVCQSAVQMVEIRKPLNVSMYFTSEVDDNYTVNSDSRRVEQVLVNYLSNACKHTTKGEIHLHLSLSENPGRVTLSVTDTGEGIPKEMAHDIFERYKKGVTTADGSGLGLHICSTIAEKLGADVKLDTTYTGGARFLFIL